MRSAHQDLRHRRAERHSAVGRSLLAAGFVSLIGCTDGGAPSGPPSGPTAPPATVIGSLSITPGETTIALQSTVMFTAVARDASGNVLANEPVSWSTSNSAIASVDQTGLVRGEGVGPVRITATTERPTAGGSPATATATLTVLPILGPIVGEKIVFNTDRDGNSEIYLMDPDGTNLVNLTRNTAQDIQPTWSPDGSRIAFTSDRSGNFELYSMNADGTGLTRLTNHDGWDLFPSWSGTRIAFERETFEPGQFLEIFVMNEDGTGAVNVTNNPDFARGPSLSRDGTRIVFQSDRDFDIDFTEIDPEIYVMNADGSNPVNLTNTDEAADGFPEWSPDGTRIAFESNRDGGFDIFVMNADGSDPMNLTRSTRDEFGASWSPDGSTLVFMRLAGNGMEDIYTMRTDGTGLTQLTNHPGVDGWPAWRSR